MQSGPYAGPGPLGQAAPAGHARAEAQSLRQVFPGDPGEDKQNALEHQPARMPLAPGMPDPTLNPGQQHLDHNPHPLADRWRAITGASLVTLVRSGATFRNGVLIVRSEGAAA